MDVHLMGLVLAVVALAVLVVTFRMGTRAFGRASVPAALVLLGSRVPTQRMVSRMLTGWTR